MREGRSGIEYSQQYKDLGLRTNVHGPLHLKLEEFVDRKLRRFMGDGAAFNYLALLQAIEDRITSYNVCYTKLLRARLPFMVSYR